MAKSSILQKLFQWKYQWNCCYARCQISIPRPLSWTSGIQLLKGWKIREGRGTAMGINALKIFVLPFPSLPLDSVAVIAGVQRIDGPLQVKYWGVRTRATPAALTPMGMGKEGSGGRTGRGGGGEGKEMDATSLSHSRLRNCYGCIQALLLKHDLSFGQLRAPPLTRRASHWSVDGLNTSISPSVAPFDCVGDRLKSTSTFVWPFELVSSSRSTKRTDTDTALLNTLVHNISKPVST